MFNISATQGNYFGDRMAGVGQAITSALAYENGLENSNISASVENDTVYLVGSANSFEAIDIAINLASSISSCRVLSRVEQCY